MICVFFPPPEFHCWKMGTIINCFHQNCIVETRKYSYSLHWYCAIKHSDKVGCRTLLKKSVWKAGKKVNDRISGLATIWSSSFGFFEWIVSDMKKTSLKTISITPIRILFESLLIKNYLNPHSFTRFEFCQNSINLLIRFLKTLFATVFWSDSGKICD